MGSPSAGFLWPMAATLGWLEWELCFIADSFARDEDGPSVGH